MHCEEKLLRELFPSRGENVERAILEKITKGESVIFHFEDGSEITTFKPSEAKRVLCEYFGWKCEPGEVREVSEAFKAKADEGSHHGTAKHG